MVILLLATLAGVFAAPAHYVLHEETSIWDVALEDINGDGKVDVFALCCDEESDPLRKYLAIHLARGAGVYPPAPSFTLDLDPNVGTVYFAEVDGTPPVELVALDAESATVFRYNTSAFEPAKTCAFRSLLPSGSKEPLFLKKATEDLDGDGIDEWLIPTAACYEVRTADRLVAKVDCDVVSRIHMGDTVYITHRLPAYHAFDVEGYEQKCLAFLSDEYADFAYGPNWSEHTRFHIPENLEEKWEASAKMDDINGDGLPDLVVTQTKGTVNLRVLTQVYLANGPFSYPKVATATFETKGAIASPALEDVDGDERPDLVFIRIPFGLTTFVNYFLRGRVTVHLDVHVFNGTGFDPKPTFQTKLSLDAPEGREQVAYSVGDFNGDGRLDVAFGNKANKLAIFTGSEDRFMSKRPWITLELPTFGVARTEDLNNNGCDDIVLFHPAGDLKKQIEVVVF